MNRTTDQANTPDSSDDLMQKILSAQTPDELGDILRQSGL
jgi:hypothetical protein